MGFFSKLFSSTDVAKDVVSATIATGDKLFYTSEEKADMKMKMIEFFPTLLTAYHPFKLAQRILAIIFTVLFSIAFLTGLGMSVYNIYAKFKFGKDAVLLDIEPLINIINAFSLDYIILAIVSFYFAGGAIESLMRKGK